MTAAAIVVAAVVARAGMVASPPFWIDELITWDVARQPVLTSAALEEQMRHGSSIAGFCLRDTGPGPLAYVLEGFLAWRADVYGGEWLLRLPGALAGIAAVLAAVAFALAAPRRASRAAWLVAAGLLAVHPIFAMASLGARGYGWVILGCVVMLGLGERLVEARVRAVPTILAWCAVATALAFIHPATLVLTAPVGLEILIGMRRPGRLWFSAGALFAGTAIVLWLTAWQHGLANYGRNVIPDASLARFWTMLGGLARSTVTEPYSAALALTVLLGAAGGFAAPRTRRGRFIRAAGFGTLLFSALLLFALLARFQYQSRYFIPLLVVASLGAGHGCSAIWRRARGPRRWMREKLTEVLVLFALLGALVSHFESRRPEQDWRSALAVIAESGDAGVRILTGPNSEHVVVERYIPGSGVTASLPARIDFGDRVLQSTDHEAILRLGTLGESAWFVTAHWGQVRPPAYWEAVADVFEPVAEIPGRQPIRVLRTPAAD